MIYDQPNIDELELMINFCNDAKYLFIYGCEEKQQKLSKYLMMSKINVNGFIISKRLHWEFSVCNLPIYTLEEIEKKHYSKDEVSIILALPGNYYNDVLCRLQSMNYKNLFLMSEYNKNTIAYKMRPRIREQFWVEVNLADHCNLNCQMCDHFSPLAKPKFLNINQYEKDIIQLAKLTNHKIGLIKLQGGEPLLNNQIISFIEITRKYFPESVIFLFTNGLLLTQWEKNIHGNLWKSCYDNNVHIELTIYPIAIDLNKIKDLEIKYNVKINYFTEAADRAYTGIKHSVKHPFRLEGDVEDWQFISCYQFNESITLRDGKLYTCPMIPYIEHFNNYFHQNLQVSKNDYLDIHTAKTYEELSEFVTHRTNFCNYCDIRNRRVFEWRQSVHIMEEYIDTGI